MQRTVSFAAILLFMASFALLPSRSAAQEPDATAESTGAASAADNSVHSTENEPAGYREAVDHALSELLRGHFSEAHAMFLRAHALFPSARTLRGLSLSEFELRTYTESIRHAEESLASPVRPLDAALREEMQQLAERARGYVTQLDLTIRPADARAELDGVLTDTTRGPLLLNAGEHTLDLSAEGYQRQQRRVSALGGDAQRLLVVLEPQPRVSDSAHDDSHALRKNPWLWTGVGVVLAAAAVTVAVLATRSHGSTAPPYGGTADVSIPAP
ncbi:MAG: hypothetical protein JWN04_3485 [Myxococcaceae bacterium]|nr:hypothetical protein [Myxococcaceae bacterium]